MKTSSFKIFLSSLFIGILLFSCATDLSNSKVIKGNKETITQSRTVDPNFTKIIKTSFIDVKLIEGTSDGKLEIYGESNVLPYIQAKVKDSGLILSVNDSVNIRRQRPVIISLTTNQIQEITSSGSGDTKTEGSIKTDRFKIKRSGSGNMHMDFDVQDLDIHSSGSGDIRLAGTAKNLKFNKSGSGNLEAFHLTVDHADIEVSGSGDTEIRVNKELNLQHSGSGDVSYKGQPKMQINSSGSGEVKNDN